MVLTREIPSSTQLDHHLQNLIEILADFEMSASALEAIRNGMVQPSMENCHPEIDVDPRIESDIDSVTDKLSTAVDTVVDFVQENVGSVANLVGTFFSFW